MGWKLAQAAHDAGLAGIVSERARLVLEFMCWHTRDNPTEHDPAALYWGGHHQIATYVMGDRGSTEAGAKAIQRAIAELLRAGLITQTRRATASRPACYLIEVGNRWSPPVDKSGQGTLVNTWSGGHPRPPEVDTHVR